MPDPLDRARRGPDRVIPRLRVIDRGDDNARCDAQVEVRRRPTALFFNRPQGSQENR